LKQKNNCSLLYTPPYKLQLHKTTQLLDLMWHSFTSIIRKMEPACSSVMSVSWKMPHGIKTCESVIWLTLTVKSWKPLISRRCHVLFSDRWWEVLLWYCVPLLHNLNFVGGLTYINQSDHFNLSWNIGFMYGMPLT
jgi:hypothetical protein